MKTKEEIAARMRVTSLAWWHANKEKCLIKHTEWQKNNRAKQREYYLRWKEKRVAVAPRRLAEGAYSDSGFEDIGRDKSSELKSF